MLNIIAKYLNESGSKEVFCMYKYFNTVGKDLYRQEVSKGTSLNHGGQVLFQSNFSMGEVYYQVLDNFSNTIHKQCMGPIINKCAYNVVSFIHINSTTYLAHAACKRDHRSESSFE